MEKIEDRATLKNLSSLLATASPSFLKKRKRTKASRSFPHFPQTFPFPLLPPLSFQHLPPKPAPSSAPSPLSNGLSSPSPGALISLYISQHSLYPLLSQPAHSSSPIEASCHCTSSRRKQQQSNGSRGRENRNERDLKRGRPRTNLERKKIKSKISCCVCFLFLFCRSLPM